MPTVKLNIKKPKTILKQLKKHGASAMNTSNHM